MLLRTYRHTAAFSVALMIFLSSSSISLAQTSSSSVSSQSSSSTASATSSQNEKTTPAESKGKQESEQPKASCTETTCVKCQAASQTVQGIVFIVMTLFLIYFVRVIFSQLKGQWDLKEALSEEADFSAQAGAAPTAPTGKPIMIASTSRLIALIGTIVLTVFFLGLVYYVLWALFNCSKMSAPDDVKLVLYAGIALFAPYATNKLSEMFKMGK